jgi:hypothetical protein
MGPGLPAPENVRALLQAALAPLPAPAAGPAAPPPGPDATARAAIAGFALVRALTAQGGGEAERRAAALGFDGILGEAWRGWGGRGLDAPAAARLALLLLRFAGRFRALADGAEPRGALLGALFGDAPAAAFLGVNEWEGARWFRKEPFEALAAALPAAAGAEAAAFGAPGEADELGPKARAAARALAEAGAASGWRVDRALAGEPEPARDEEPGEPARDPDAPDPGGTRPGDADPGSA